MWVQLAILVISYIISAALAPKPPQPKPAALKDFQFPIAEAGTPIIEVFGDVWIKGSNVAWFGDLTTTAIKSSGGKK